MPLIEVTTFDITKEEKIALVNGLAEKAHEITGIERKYFTVIIRTVEGPECWGHEGKSLIERDYYKEKYVN